MRHACPPLGLDQPLGHLAKEFDRSLGVGLGGIDHVDHRLDSGQCLVEPLAAQDVDSARAGDHDRLVAGALEPGDDRGADQPGPSGYGDPHFAQSSLGGAIGRGSKMARILVILPSST